MGSIYLMGDNTSTKGRIYWISEEPEWFEGAGWRPIGYNHYKAGKYGLVILEEYNG